MSWSKTLASPRVWAEAGHDRLRCQAIDLFQDGTVAVAGGHGPANGVEEQVHGHRLEHDVIRPGGDCVVYGSGAAQFNLPFFPLIVRNIVLRFFIVYNLDDGDRERAVATLTELLERNALSHNIAERLPLAQIAQAHEFVEQGRAVGNVVLAIP